MAVTAAVVTAAQITASVTAASAAVSAVSGALNQKKNSTAGVLVNGTPFSLATIPGTGRAKVGRWAPTVNPTIEPLSSLSDKGDHMDINSFGLNAHGSGVYAFVCFDITKDVAMCIGVDNRANLRVPQMALWIGNPSNGMLQKLKSNNGTGEDAWKYIRNHHSNEKNVALSKGETVSVTFGNFTARGQAGTKFVIEMRLDPEDDAWEPWLEKINKEDATDGTA